jgi:hypothetical protein
LTTKRDLTNLQKIGLRRGRCKADHHFGCDQSATMSSLVITKERSEAMGRRTLCLVLMGLMFMVGESLYAQSEGAYVTWSTWAQGNQEYASESVAHYGGDWPIYFLGGDVENDANWAQAIAVVHWWRNGAFQNWEWQEAQIPNSWTLITEELWDRQFYVYCVLEFRKQTGELLASYTSSVQTVVAHRNE